MPSLPSLSPIFTKELRTTLRSNKSVLFLFLILALISGVFMLFWMEQSELTMSLGGRAQFSRTIFLFIASCQFLALSLISPMMTATVITGERESKTLDLLFCTGISRMHILLAKWISAIAYQLILLVCMLPILALIFQLGGVGLDEYLAAALLIAQAVVTYGMLGAAVSSRFRRTTSSLMMSLFLVLGLVVLFPIGLWIIVMIFGSLPWVGRSMASNSDILPVLMSVSPITTAIYAAGFGRGGSAVSLSGLLGTPALRMHLGFQAFVFLSSAWVAWRGLIRKEVERAAVAKRIVDDKAILERRRKRWPYYLIDPLRRAQEIGDRENPVFVKEKRVSNLAKPHVLIRICYVGLFLSIISLFAVFQEQPLEAAKFVALWTISFVIACAPILASTSVSREREENTLDLLRTSMVTPWGIIWAKFSIALRFLAYLCASFVLLPILLGLSVSLLYPSEQWGTRLVSTFLAFVKIIPFLLSFSALYAAVGIYCSSKSRKNVTAIVSTYGWSGVFLLFPLLLTWFSAIIEAWWYRDRRRDWLSPLLISIRDWAGPLLSPYYYFSDGFRSRYSDGRHNFANWDSWGQIAVHTLLMLGLTGAILKLAEWRLKRSVRQ